MDSKICVVTGGAAGIGRGIVECLLQSGACVVIADWNEGDGEQTIRELTEFDDRVAFLRTDVSSEKDIDSVIAYTLDRWKQIDVVVNNVGTHYYEEIANISLENWDRVITTDLRGNFLMSQKALPSMKKNGNGSIVHIASVHAWQTLPHFSVYAAAKGGIVSMGRVMALECAPYGIRVNTILPGMTRNKKVDQHLSSLPANERPAALKKMADTIPLGRIADPRDIGDLVVFLSSERASYITGATIPVDGGVTARLS
jgi:NAD(P)-dependent dehydrogenase (short-subunit alcohol dehydrogenase family)